MKPEKMVVALRAIASKIDMSESPKRNLVVSDLKKVMAALNDGDSSGEPEVSEDNSVDPEISDAISAALTDAQGGDKVVSASGQSYTAAILAQLSAWLRDVDDPVGADMMKKWSQSFAVHESSVL